MNIQSRTRRSLILATLSLLMATACSGGVAPVTPSPSPSPSPVPSEPSPSGGPSGGASADPGAPTIVIARPGQLGPHPVVASSLEPIVEGRHVTVKLTWYSGVEPCNVLDSVKVDQAGGEIILTIIEGSSDLDAVCIEIAQLKTTVVDVGALEPGRYTISSPGGEAKPVVITIG